MLTCKLQLSPGAGPRERHPRRRRPGQLPDHVQHPLVCRVQLPDDARIFGHFHHQSLHGSAQSGDAGGRCVRHLQLDPAAQRAVRAATTPRGAPGKGEVLQSGFSLSQKPTFSSLKF